MERNSGAERGLGPEGSTERDVDTENSSDNLDAEVIESVRSMMTNLQVAGPSAALGRAPSDDNLTSVDEQQTNTSESNPENKSVKWRPAQTQQITSSLTSLTPNAFKVASGRALSRAAKRKSSTNINPRVCTTNTPINIERSSDVTPMLIAQSTTASMVTNFVQQPTAPRRRGNGGNSQVPRTYGASGNRHNSVSLPSGTTQTPNTGVEAVAALNPKAKTKSRRGGRRNKNAPKVGELEENSKVGESSGATSGAQSSNLMNLGLQTSSPTFSKVAASNPEQMGRKGSAKKSHSDAMASILSLFRKMKENSGEQRCPNPPQETQNRDDFRVPLLNTPSAASGCTSPINSEQRRPSQCSQKRDHSRNLISNNPRATSLINSERRRPHKETKRSRDKYLSRVAAARLERSRNPNQQRSSPGVRNWVPSIHTPLNLNRGDSLQTYVRLCNQEAQVRHWLARKPRLTELTELRSANANREDILDVCEKLCQEEEQALLWLADRPRFILPVEMVNPRFAYKNRGDPLDTQARLCRQAEQLQLWNAGRVNVPNEMADPRSADENSNYMNTQKVDDIPQRTSMSESFRTPHSVQDQMFQEDEIADLDNTENTDFRFDDQQHDHSSL